MALFVVTLASELKFSLETIARLTLTQIKHFQKALHKKKMYELSLMAMAMRTSAHSQAHDFENWMAKLIEDPEEQVMTGSEFAQEFDLEGDNMQGLVASNRPKEWFDQYLNKKQVVVEDI